MSEFNLGMGGCVRPIDLDPWAFYALPVLGEEGFLLGDPKSNNALNCSRFMLPHVDPVLYDENRGDPSDTESEASQTPETAPTQERRGRSGVRRERTQSRRPR